MSGRVPGIVPRCWTLYPNKVRIASMRHLVGKRLSHFGEPLATHWLLLMRIWTLEIPKKSWFKILNRTLSKLDRQILKNKLKFRVKQREKKISGLSLPIKRKQSKSVKTTLSPVVIELRNLVLLSFKMPSKMIIYHIKKPGKSQLHKHQIESILGLTVSRCSNKLRRNSNKLKFNLPKTPLMKSNN